MLCRDCTTIWINPLATAPSAAEVVSALAHEVGHMLDPLSPAEPSTDTPEGLARERERELAAWAWAESFLRSDPAVWAELEPVFNGVKNDRLRGYAKRWGSLP
jgi:hypothetical protein